MKEKVLTEGIPKYFPTHTKGPQTTANQDTQLKGQDKHVKNQDVQLKGQDAQLKNQDMRPKSQDTQLKSQDKKAPVFMDSLADRAADLSISGAADSALSQHPPTRFQALQEGEGQVRRSPRIKAKRVRSALDEVRAHHLCTLNQ